MILRGIGVGRGAAVGPVAVARPAPEIPEERVDDADAAAAAALGALSDVAEALEGHAARAEGARAEVLAATAAMARDRALAADVERRVRDGAGPARALRDAVDAVCAMLEAAGGMFAERTTDLRSVGDRAVARVLGLPEPGIPSLDEPSVVVAADLAPADTAGLDPDRLLALVTERGGPTGHTAIVARQLGVPCLVRVPGAAALAPGTRVAVDAAAGELVVDPPADVVERLAARQAALAALAEDTGPGATADGHPVALLANVGDVPGAVAAAATAVEGVGLLRTEVLFLDRRTAPTLDEQADAYAEVLRAFAGRKVVVRTLDAGADKPLAFVPHEAEENPALGVRGYRLVRTAPELLDTQLAALAEAARRTGAEPWVMAPMVATPAEAADFRERARAAGLPVAGVMVEVPSAALQAAEVLAEVDFVSLGTNDLAQYTMATDRLRGSLDDLLDPWQPAVLALVARTAAAGRAAGRPVGVCGESAADPVMALVLAGLGVTSLSMAPSAVPAVRFALRAHTLVHVEEIARAATAAPDAARARAAATALVAAQVREVLGL
jgi:phosphotransferase system enzyme I (PtsI)